MLTPSLFNGMPYAGEATVIPLKMHLYIQALAFVQGMTLRAVLRIAPPGFWPKKRGRKDFDGGMGALRPCPARNGWKCMYGFRRIWRTTWQRSAAATE